jgi:hypothetical protein
MTTTTNAERLRKYKAGMNAAGFHRLTAYVHPALKAFINQNRLPHECTGRTLERLLLGQARKRPEF